MQKKASDFILRLTLCNITEKGVRLIFRYYILSIITALSGGKIKSDTFFLPLPLFSGFPPARE
jgi:hypothetical protein